MKQKLEIKQKPKVSFKEKLQIVKEAFTNGCMGKYNTLGHGFARDCPIVVKRVGFHRFEYVMYRPQDKQFYGAYLNVVPEWWRLFAPQTYSEKQLKSIKVRLANMAISTVDTLESKDEYKDQ